MHPIRDNFNEADQLLTITAVKPRWLRNDKYKIEIRGVTKRPNDETIQMLASNILKNQEFDDLHAQGNIRGRVEADSIYTLITDFPKRILHFFTSLISKTDNYHLIDPDKLNQLFSLQGTVFLDNEILAQLAELKRNKNSFNIFNNLTELMKPENLKARNEGIKKLIGEELKDPDEVNRKINEVFEYIGKIGPSYISEIKVDETKKLMDAETNRRMDILQGRYRSLIKTSVSKQEFDRKMALAKLDILSSRRVKEFLDKELTDELRALEAEKNKGESISVGRINELAKKMEPANLAERLQTISKFTGLTLVSADNPDHIDKKVQNAFEYMGIKRPATWIENPQVYLDINDSESQRRRDILNRYLITDVALLKPGVSKQAFESHVNRFIKTSNTLDSLLDRRGKEFIDQDLLNKLNNLREVKSALRKDFSDAALQVFTQNVDQINTLMKPESLKQRADFLLNCLEWNTTLKWDYLAHALTIDNKIREVYSFFAKDKPAEIDRFEFSLMLSLFNSYAKLNAIIKQKGLPRHYSDFKNHFLYVSNSQNEMKKWVIDRLNSDLIKMPPTNRPLLKELIDKAAASDSLDKLAEGYENYKTAEEVVRNFTNALLDAQFENISNEVATGFKVIDHPSLNDLKKSLRSKFETNLAVYKGFLEKYKNLDMAHSAFEEETKNLLPIKDLVVLLTFNLKANKTKSYLFKSIDDVEKVLKEEYQANQNEEIINEIVSENDKLAEGKKFFELCKQPVPENFSKKNDADKFVDIKTAWKKGQLLYRGDLALNTEKLQTINAAYETLKKLFKMS